MPHTTVTGVLKAGFEAIRLSSPKVAGRTRRRLDGRMPANLCHLDNRSAWTANQLRGIGTDNRSLSSPRTKNRKSADAVRLALTGGRRPARSLSRWHLGWEPAVQARGRIWIPPGAGTAFGRSLCSGFAAWPSASLKTTGSQSDPGQPTTTPGAPDSRPADSKRRSFERWSREMSADRDQNLADPHAGPCRLGQVCRMAFQRLIPPNRDDRGSTLEGSDRRLRKCFFASTAAG